MSRQQIDVIERLRAEIEALPSGARRECLRREYHRQHDYQTAVKPAPERRLDTSDQYSQLPVKRLPR